MAEVLYRWSDEDGDTITVQIETDGDETYAVVMTSNHHGREVCEAYVPKGEDLERLIEALRQAALTGPSLQGDDQ